MGWGAAIGAGASFISGIAQGKAEQSQMRAVQSENDRLNKQTWAAMAQRINTVNLQRGLLRQQTGTDLLNIGKEANRAFGASVTSAAAAGIEGASVDETASDIQRQNQTSQAQTRFNEQVQEMNLDTSIEDIVNTAVAAQRYSQKPISTGQIIGRAVGSASMQFVTSLAASSFDYLPTSGSASGATGASGTGLNTTNWMERAQFNDFNTSYNQSRNVGYSNSGFYGG